MSRSTALRERPDGSRNLAGRMNSRMQIAALLLFLCLTRWAALDSAAAGYLLCASNERSGNVSVFSGEDYRLVKDIPVGKRPRGIHSSPDGRFLYVAVSGSPITGPPKLDAKGNPIPEKDDDDDADHSADGIAVVDLQQTRFLRKLPAGSDPEEFAVMPDGEHLFISNEDVGTASLLNVSSEKIEAIVPVKREPEGVALTPDGQRVFVTCEAGGEVFVIDRAACKVIGNFVVGGRPRTVAFSPDGARAYIPSESAGQIHLVDAKELKIQNSVRLPAGFRPMGTRMNRDGTKLYVSTGRAGQVAILDPKTLGLVKSIKVGARPWGMAFSPDGTRLFVANGPSNDLSVIDTGSDTEIQRIKAGDGPWGVTVVQRTVSEK
jgi:YVTN family beta-propeller protein